MNNANLATSVHQRLLNKSRELGENFNRLMGRYVQERLLYRLSLSEHGDTFVLKGAVLFIAWTGQLYRPTKDIDFLGYGIDSIERITSVFQQVCLVEIPPDGVVFDAESVQVEDIRDQELYGGKRVRLVGHLGSARVPVHIDVGFGDVVTPDVQMMAFPTLLEFPSPKINVYPPETAIAEKVQAMVALGIRNSRMKDFYDLWQFAQHFTFEGETLVAAIRATFSRRETEIPKDYPVGLSDVFAEDRDKITQWQAFLRRGPSDDDNMNLRVVIDNLRIFLGPPLFAACKNESLGQSWHPGGPWIRSIELRNSR